MEIQGGQEDSIINRYRHFIVLGAFAASIIYTFGYDELLGDYTRSIALGLELVGAIVYFLSCRATPTNRTTTTYQPQAPLQSPPRTFSDIEQPKDVFQKFDEVKK